MSQSPTKTASFPPATKLSYGTPLNGADTGSDSNPRSRPLRSHLRAPALPLLLSVIAGILVDSVFSPPLGGLLILAVAAGSAFLFLHFLSHAKLATLSLLGCCFLTAAARFHAETSVASPNHIARFASETPQLITLRATVESSPRIASAPSTSSVASYFVLDQSSCEILATEILVGNSSIPVSGRLRLDVSGHLLHVEPGDEVRIVGELSIPSAPRNPGSYDFRRALARQGIHAQISSDHPATVTRTRSASQFSPAKLRSRLREHALDLIVRYLRPSAASVAAAMLLGDRSNLSESTRLAFAQSGTMHLLAISGLNIAILWLLLNSLCRLVYLGPLATAWFVLIGIISYAVITDLQPSVTRATAMAAFVQFGRIWFRHVGGVQLISLCAVLLLLFRPADLFDIGAQLSFLSILALQQAAIHLPSMKLSKSKQALLTPIQIAISRIVRPVVLAYFVTAIVWLFTLPWTARTFHLVPPLGFLVEAFVSPLGLATISFGYLFLAIGLLIPSIAWLPAFLFETLLNLFLAVVNWTGQTRWGHLYIPMIPTWWLVGFYGLIFAWLVVSSRLVWRKRLVIAGLSWLAVGLSVGLFPATRNGLKTTVLSVGHGLAILVELPNGKTLLYDAGMIGEGSSAARIVQRALWQSGHSRIDALIISHADSDHYNAVPSLLRTISVGTLFVPRSFLDFRQPGIEQLCESAHDVHVPIRILQSGDALNLDPAVQLSVLLPDFTPPRGDDNAHSVVVRLNYADRNLLLTGDLEGSGLDELVSQPPIHTHILFSPHHGSRNGNSPVLENWATPEIVIASSERKNTVEILRSIYSLTPHVFSTSNSGAISVEISQTGRVSVAEYLRREMSPQVLIEEQ